MASSLSLSPSSSALISPAAKLRLDLYSPESVGDSDDCDDNPPLVISVLASLLQRMASKNSNKKCPLPLNSSFHCQSTMNLSIHSFLRRVLRYARPSSSVFVVAYVYLDRLRPSLPLSSSNSQRVLLTTILLASKFLQDVNYKNSHYAKIGGVTMKEMNKMEVEMLFMMGFRLHVNVRVFESYCEHLEREVSLGGGYQIERVLVNCLCPLEDSNGEKKPELSQIAKLIL